MQIVLMHRLRLLKKTGKQLFKYKSPFEIFSDCCYVKFLFHFEQASSFLVLERSGIMSEQTITSRMLNFQEALKYIR